MGQILHSKVHGTYSKLSNILVWLVGYRKGDCSSAKKLDSHTTLPFGAVSILIARRASNRTRPFRTTYLDIHTWRTDFPASWTTTVAIYPCHRRLPVDDEARRKKQASEGYFHCCYKCLAFCWSQRMRNMLFKVLTRTWARLELPRESFSNAFRGSTGLWKELATTLLYISWIGTKKCKVAWIGSEEREIWK